MISRETVNIFEKFNVLFRTLNASLRCVENHRKVYGRQFFKIGLTDDY